MFQTLLSIPLIQDEIKDQLEKLKNSLNFFRIFEKLF